MYDVHSACAEWKLACMIAYIYLGHHPDHSLLTRILMYALALAVLTGAYAWSNSTVTAEKTYFTTYCPSPTTFTHGTGTYTVTEATTLSIEDCDCTKSSAPTSAAASAANSTVPTSAPAEANGAAAKGAAAAAGVAAAVAYLI